MEREGGSERGTDGVWEGREGREGGTGREREAGKGRKVKEKATMIFVVMNCFII